MVKVLSIWANGDNMKKHFYYLGVLSQFGTVENFEKQLGEMYDSKLMDKDEYDNAIDWVAEGKYLDDMAKKEAEKAIS